MQFWLGDHPSDEVLERYLLHKSTPSELEALETHILACEDCVTRLEETEDYISALQGACLELKNKRTLFSTAMAALWSAASWLTPVRLSWTAAAAIAFAVLVVAPAQFAHLWPVAPERVNLVAWRGASAPSVRLQHPLSVRLSSVDLPDGTVAVQLVDSVGREVSHGSTSIAQESAQLALPALRTPGAYYLRLYSIAGTKSGERDLLREFAIEAK